METIPLGDDSKGMAPELATAVYTMCADNHRERAGIAERAQVGTVPFGCGQEPRHRPPLRILSREAQTINREPRRRGLPPSPPQIRPCRGQAWRWFELQLFGASRVRRLWKIGHSCARHEGLGKCAAVVWIPGVKSGCRPGTASAEGQRLFPQNLSSPRQDGFFDQAQLLHKSLTINWLPDMDSNHD